MHTCSRSFTLAQKVSSTEKKSKYTFSLVEMGWGWMQVSDLFTFSNVNMIQLIACALARKRWVYKKLQSKPKKNKRYAEFLNWRYLQTCSNDMIKNPHWSEGKWENGIDRERYRPVKNSTLNQHEIAPKNFKNCWQRCAKLNAGMMLIHHRNIFCKFRWPLCLSKSECVWCTGKLYAAVSREH